MINMEDNSVRNDDIEAQKNLAWFQTYRTDVYGGVTQFTGMF